MSAYIPNGGPMRQLDKPAEPDEQFTVEHAQDPRRLAEVVMRILRDLASLRRRWWPEHIDYRDKVVDGTGTTFYRFPHGFGGRVNYWPVRWSGAAAPNLVYSSTSDDDTLVLTSTSAGTVTLRVEAAG
jgi:hypothetical protein